MSCHRAQTLEARPLDDGTRGNLAGQIAPSHNSSQDPKLHSTSVYIVLSRMLQTMEERSRFQIALASSCVEGVLVHWRPNHLVCCLVIPRMCQKSLRYVFH